MSPENPGEERDGTPFLDDSNSHSRSMYGIYANIGGILMVNVTIYSIHGSYGIFIKDIKGR